MAASLSVQWSQKARMDARAVELLSRYSFVPWAGGPTLIVSDLESTLRDGLRQLEVGGDRLRVYSSMDDDMGVWVSYPRVDLERIVIAIGKRIDAITEAVRDSHSAISAAPDDATALSITLDSFLGDGQFNYITARGVYQVFDLEYGTSWTLAHSLRVARPSVTVVTSGGQMVFTDIEYPSDTSVIITTKNAMSGTATLI